jgi:hypothetical protein
MVVVPFSCFSLPPEPCVHTEMDWSALHGIVEETITAFRPNGSGGKLSQCFEPKKELPQHEHFPTEIFQYIWYFHPSDLNQWKASSPWAIPYRNLPMYVKIWSRKPVRFLDLPWASHCWPQKWHTTQTPVDQPHPPLLRANAMRWNTGQQNMINNSQYWDWCTPVGIIVSRVW